MRLKPFLLLKIEDLTSGNQISPKPNKSLFYYARNVFKDLPILAAQTHETGAMQPSPTDVDCNANAWAFPILFT